MSKFITWPAIDSRILSARDPIAWVQAHLTVSLLDGRGAYPTAETAKLLIAHHKGGLGFIPVAVGDGDYELVGPNILDAIAADMDLATRAEADHYRHMAETSHREWVESGD